MKKILVGGFQHETNTFSPVLTPFEAFEIADEWPGLSRHQALLDNFSTSCNIPISGFLQNSEQHEFDCIPSVWTSASPSGKVTEEAYEHIVTMLLEDIKNNPDIDGIFLDLHGAMVTSHLDDGEGELLKRIRNLVGFELPIVIALDFHANLTQDMLTHANEMCIYKTYPHIDMFETGQRATNALTKILNHTNKSFKSLKQADFIVSLNGQCTLIEPFKAIYSDIAQLEREHDVVIALAPGFGLSDIPDAGPAVAVYANTQQQADDIADQVIKRITQDKHTIKVNLYAPNDAIQFANSHHDKKPIIFADTQDNSGGGGTSDTMGVFKALIDSNVKNAVVLMILDEAVAQQAHTAGEGATIDIALGEKSEGATDTPFKGTFTIKKLSNGQFQATPGSYYEGFEVNCGLMAYLDCNGVGAIVGSRKMQAADRAMLTHLSLDPKQFDILVLKSSVHFRADFMRLSDTILMVKSPGKVTADLNELTYDHCHKERL
ncbi:MAG: microcystin degradation protein MlrC [Coxiella sp. (in: Bacteria)]|nr:MAG: microcystin degradation protein MlrC [Coxiella sp. (in: g-proteobacteria)]